MGKWNDYLTELMRKNVKWDDPKLLMCKFGITERAAQQVIDRRKAEIDDAAELTEAQREWEEISDGSIIDR